MQRVNRSITAEKLKGSPRGIVLLGAVAAVCWLQFSVSLGLGAGIGLGSHRDFGSFWAAGDAANRGLDPYAVYPLTRTVETPAGERPATNLNPPTSVLLFQPLAKIDPDVAFRGWQIASAALYGLILAAFLRWGQTRWPRALLMVAWEPFWSTLDLGQIYVPLTGLSAVGYLWAEDYPILAGIAIGLLAALKPQYCLWALLLLVSGHRRVGGIALAAAAVATALPLALGHGAWYADWVAALRSSDPLDYDDNLSLPSLLLRLGIPAGACFALVGIGLLTLLAVIARRRRNPRRVSTLALGTAFLVGPVSWVGYALLLAPVALAAEWSEPLLLGMLLLATPGVLLWWFHGSFVVYDLAVGLFLWAALAGRVAGSTPSGRWRSRDDRDHSVWLGW